MEPVPTLVPHLAERVAELVTAASVELLPVPLQAVTAAVRRLATMLVKSLS